MSSLHNQTQTNKSILNQNQEETTDYHQETIFYEACENSIELAKVLSKEDHSDDDQIIIKYSKQPKTSSETEDSPVTKQESNYHTENSPKSVHNQFPSFSNDDYEEEEEEEEEDEEEDYEHSDSQLNSNNKNSDSAEGPEDDDAIDHGNQRLTTLQCNTNSLLSSSSCNSPHHKIIFEPLNLDFNFLKKRLRTVITKAKNVSKDNKHFNHLIELQNFIGEQNRSALWVFKISCDGKYLATGSKKGVLRIFEIMTYDYPKYQTKYNESDIIKYFNFLNEEPIRVYSYHSGDILDIAWSPFKKDHLLTASLDYYVILWELSSPYPLMKFRHDHMVTSICFSPRNPDEFVTGCLDRIIRLWPIMHDAKPEYFNIKEKIISVTYFPSGDSLAIGTHNGKVLIYDILPSIRYNCSFSCRNRLGKNSKGKKVTNIEFVNKEAAVVTTSDSRIRYVSIPDGKMIHKYKGYKNENSMIRAFNDNSNDMIISGSEDKFCYVWHRINLENSNKKNYAYEYYKPFANEVVECSNFACEQSMSSYLKKVYKLTTKFFIHSIIVNVTDSGRIQVLLNINETL